MVQRIREGNNRFDRLSAKWNFAEYLSNPH